MAALVRRSQNLFKKWNKHVVVSLALSRALASKTQVGFVGLGNMGRPMAKNLLKQGYPIIATDIFPESCKELQDLGAQIVDCPAEIADKTDRIITMLPSSPNVIEVYTGPNGILKMAVILLIHLNCLSLDCGRRLESQEEAHTNTERACRLNTQS